ncbi:MAG: mercuric reductase [Gemmatimonadota bacterium]|nr:mercuric reductase [Gemmatimonadota bacterium]
MNADAAGVASSVAHDHDRDLLDNVRPHDWVNPEPRDRYDLVVVGAGTAGLVSAAIGAGLGARVALVERDRMGGDCLNVGCVPSKGLLRASRSWAEAHSSHERFGGPLARGDEDYATAVGRMREIRAAISDVDAAERFRSLGIDVFLGEARFDSDRSVSVDGHRLPFRRAVLATGARAMVPPIAGLETIDFLTNETVFDLDEVPERMLVLGAGAIGCELAQAFARFGSSVVLLDMEEHVLPREEPDAARVVQRAMERDGVEFLGRTKVVEASSGEGGGKRVLVESEGGRRTLEGDEVLLALGRTPNLDLDLDAAGIAFGRRGVEVDARLRTTNPRVYAVGDVASPFQFTHAADAQARLAVRNALFFGRGKSTELTIPWATYTSPELARVGLSEAEAADKGVEIETVTIDFADVDRARLDGDEDGFVRIHLEAGKDRIVGATVVHPHGGELIGQISQLMTLGVGLDSLSDVVFPYPTIAESLRKAADARRRSRLTERVSWAFNQYFRLWRRLT